jgi:hypothetical protein
MLPYPVFVNDKDYRGAPDMMKHPLLKQTVRTQIVGRVAARRYAAGANRAG